MTNIRMLTGVLFAALLASLPASVRAAEPAEPDRAELRKGIRAYADYLALPPAKRAAAAAPSFKHPPLSKADAERWRAALWAAWVEHLRDDRDDDLKKLGDPLKTGRGAVRATLPDDAGGTERLTMRYFLRTFGKKPDGGWPLYINLHSGGNNNKLNDRCWAATKSQYPIKTGLYVAPRSVKDTAESWYEPNNYALLGRLVAEAVALWGVDPDRVYLMGYSMGGWGVFHLGPAVPDRWAAVAATAGAGFVGATGRAHPDNLRNTPMMIQIGDRDLAFRRYPLSKAFAAELRKRHEADPGGYVLKYKEHAGKGHQVNDRDTPAWLARFSRDPLPKKIVWQQSIPTPGSSIGDVRRVMTQRPTYALHFRRRSYWLRNDSPGPFQRVVAGRDGNTFHLAETRYLERITILLDDRLADLDRPVVVRAGDKVLAETKLERTVDAMIRTLVPRGDPRLVFCAALTFEPPDLAARLDGRELKTCAEYLERADHRLALGRRAEAIADLEAALNRDPAQGPGRIFPTLVRLAQLQRDARKLLDAYARWAAAAPDDVQVQYACARWQLTGAGDKDLRNTDAALKHALRAAELTQRKNSAVLHLLAATQFAGGQVEEAAATEKLAVSRLPKNAGAAANAYKRALEQYEAALKAKREKEKPQ